MKLNKRIFALLLCLIISLVSPLSASAKGYISETTKCSISVAYSIDGVAAANVGFRVYQVANIYYNGVAILTNDFNDYSIAVSQLPNLASQLEVYTQVDNIEPYATASTNASGMFTVSKLHPGIYLVCGDPVEKDGMLYSCVPTVVYVPVASEDNSAWVYDVTVIPKYESIPFGSGDDIPTVDVKVLKVWEDNDNKVMRPNKVKVQLVGNGIVLDTVVLSEDNEWTYLWQGLDGSIRYSVTELEVPAYYTVSIKQEDITYIITNTSTISGPGNTGSTTPSLPQTGLLWWPVPVLAAAGIAMIVIGLVVKKEEGATAD